MYFKISFKHLEFGLQLSYFVLGVFELVKATIQMTLLLDELGMFLLLKIQEVANEIEEVSWGNVVEFLG